ncbi:hypothetical protein HV127_22070 [Klebsiella sp. RHBSTW-00215]|uniref:hypothetical protein n=1 Tax=Klebsiella sp. RHBSTW-00215 TaxID=2742640 RepID=UPI0015F4600C|nr:hypothetical protein [Klebsiella sp. RHBSTW-00215]MBA7933907.1 hypothetical protein [Klebsiella sp. RHBSTW-00215]
MKYKKAASILPFYGKKKTANFNDDATKPRPDRRLASKMWWRKQRVFKHEHNDYPRSSAAFTLYGMQSSITGGLLPAGWQAAQKK